MQQMTQADGRHAHRSTVAAGQTSEPVELPVYIPHSPVTVAVVPAVGATALIEYTLAARADIVADPNAVDWHAWDHGAVSSSKSDALIAPVTALRCTATGGNVGWSILL